MSLCKLRNVKKTYPMGDLEVHALRGVDLTVEKGEFTVIAGPSGSGKSTVLNLIGCLDRPTAGEVLLEDKPVARMGDNELGALRAARIGFIFQSFNLIPVLTAFENVELALRLAGHTERSKERVEQALRDVSLGDYMHRRPAQLSGGQQQRVAIARALVKSPALVIADEPTANLDSVNGRAILDLMREMNERDHITFLFSTHDPMVMERANRVVKLVDGLVVEDDRRGRAVASSAGTAS